MASAKETITLSAGGTSPDNNNVDVEVNEEERMSTKKKLMYQLSILVNAANHILIIFLTWFIIHYARKGSSTMYYHVIFCTVGYVLLMSEAILALGNENVWSFFLKRRNKAHIHWVLQVGGAAFTIVGVVIMYQVKSKHFRSVHAILGITALVISCVLITFGYPVFIAAKLRKLIRPSLVKFSHNILGCICFTIGMAAMCTSYEKRWIPDNKAYVSIHDESPYMLALTIIATIIPLIGAARALLNLTSSVFR